SFPPPGVNSFDVEKTLFKRINFSDGLLQADYAASRTKSNQSIPARRRDRIQSLLVKLLPDVSDIRFVDPQDSVDNVKVQFRTPYGWVNIGSLSLGYRVLISWMVDFASRMFERYPKHRDPLAQPAIVLIDEIDLHLHPKWQRQIISYLTELFPNTQFIVTAHSPLFVQSAVDANVVVLRREGDHVVIDNNPMAVQGWRVDQILTSDLFGLPSARSVELDEPIERRDRILAKKRITKKDRETLKNLEKQISDIPGGETPGDMEAMRILRQAAESLK
ncbi:MAG: AAA family ATPase, partial [Rhodospirillales bacterium]|nr:AAA family ATPase [Rhodospirillales bacterium]